MVLTAALFLAPRIARADDLDDFLAARDAYTTSEYALAVARFRPLVEQEPSPLRPGLLVPALKYYAASLLLTQHPDDATRAFERLLRLDPDVQLSNVEFSPAVIQLFLQTRQRLAEQLARLRVQRLDEERREREARERLMRELTDLATRERRIVRVPRPLMFVPFGMGQFANGDDTLGWLLLGLESSFVATALLSAVVGEIACPRSPCTIGMAPLGPLYIALNVGSWSAFGLTAVGGVIQANIAWRPERIEIRPRPPPAGFDRLRLAVQPRLDGTGLGLGLQLRF